MQKTSPQRHGPVRARTPPRRQHGFLRGNQTAERPFPNRQMHLSPTQQAMQTDALRLAHDVQPHLGLTRTGTAEAGG